MDSAPLFFLLGAFPKCSGSTLRRRWWKPNNKNNKKKKNNK